jgi:hypothetical protein
MEIFKFSKIKKELTFFLNEKKLFLSKWKLALGYCRYAQDFGHKNLAGA